MSSTPPSVSSIGSPEPEPCPNEGTPPLGAPGSVNDAEGIIRLVPSRVWLIRDGRGNAALGPTAFSRDELSQRKGKSASVLRDMTASAEIERRARALNSEPLWVDDPVIATASVFAVRHIVDSGGRREVCVNADPTSKENDRLGPCSTHASVVRACPPLDQKQRIEWAGLRQQLAMRFSRVTHVSGRTVDVTNL